MYKNRVRRDRDCSGLGPPGSGSGFRNFSGSGLKNAWDPPMPEI
jgi:hypothetical protein